uniref:Uncharacterized protein n=1 Tax=uncultured marine bacterium HF10_45G01 TaxID=415446 RepID=A4GJQ2_9BACT|nr:hypothetical protein ALOHA_HF1045G01.0014 [uncultured marine bacterium HF10_45G01]
MILKILVKCLLFSILFINIVAKANDITAMSGISEAAGSSAQAAADQLASDAGKVAENISGATAALGEAKSDIGKALDVSIAQAENAMAFATESLAKGDITSAVQAMSLVEGVTDMALGALPDPTALDMSGIDFAKDFSPEEMAALSSIAGQMGAGKVVSLQKMAGQMNALGAAGFDAKGMMGSLDAQGIGMGAAMEGLANAGMVDMESITGSANFDIANFNPGDFASMNVAEMGMNPAMMAGALNALPVGAATAALETLASNPEAMGQMGKTMTGAIVATMSAKGMGDEMMKSMEANIGIQGMADMAKGMDGIEGMQEIGKVMANVGMEQMAETLQTAFANPEAGIVSAMSGTVGMISQAISGKAPKEQTAIQKGMAMESSFANNMSAPEALEMPENISETGMMMGAMVMAKPSLAGGLPGAMAPPEGMTALGMGAIDPNNPAGTMMSGVMENMSKAEMGEAMANMTGMEVGEMDKLGMADMAMQTGLTPGMVASMGAAGISGMDVSTIMSTNVAGLGSKAIQGVAQMAKAGKMSAANMGDMMEVGLVNQGTMAAMGAEGMKGLSGAMGMEGGDMGLAAMSGGMVGMGEMNLDAQMNPEMAASMGLTAGPEGAKLGDIMGGAPEGFEGGMKGGMNLGQVSAAMGTGVDPGAAIGNVAGAAMAADGEGGLAGAAMGSAMAAQGAAASAMGSHAMGAAMGMEGMGEGDMGKAMGGAMQEGMSGTMGGAMAGAMAGGPGGPGGMGPMGDMGGPMGGPDGGPMGDMGPMGGDMGGAMGDIGGAVEGAMGAPGGPGDPGPGGPGGPGDPMGGPGDPGPGPGPDPK